MTGSPDDRCTLDVICARPQQGKSLLATKIIYDQLLLGSIRPQYVNEGADIVITNLALTDLPLKLKGYSRLKELPMVLQVISKLDMNRIIIIDIDDMTKSNFENLIDSKQKELGLEYCRVLIVIDEGYTILDSRRATDKRVIDFSNFINFRRHWFARVIVILQDLNRLDKTLRKQTENMYSIKKENWNNQTVFILQQYKVYPTYIDEASPEVVYTEQSLKPYYFLYESHNRRNKTLLDGRL